MQDPLSIAEEVIKRFEAKEPRTYEENNLYALAKHVVAAEKCINSLYEAVEKRLDFGAIALGKRLRRVAEDMYEIATERTCPDDNCRCFDLEKLMDEAKSEQWLAHCIVCGDNRTFSFGQLCASCDQMPKAVSVLVPGRGRNPPYLAVSRRDAPDKFGLPGGKVEGKETLERAAQRELYEETGLVVPVDSLRLIHAAVCKGEVDYLCFTYIGDVDIQPTKAEEGLTVAWVSRETLEAGPFGAYLKPLLEWYEPLVKAKYEGFNTSNPNMQQVPRGRDNADG